MRLRDVCDQLQEAGLPPRVMIDCSHANSNKDHTSSACGLPRCCRADCRGKPEHHSASCWRATWSQEHRSWSQESRWSMGRASPTRAWDGTRHRNCWRSLRRPFGLGDEWVGGAYRGRARHGRAFKRKTRAFFRALASMNLLWYIVLNKVQHGRAPTAAKNPADFLPHGGG